MFICDTCDYFYCDDCCVGRVCYINIYFWMCLCLKIQRTLLCMFLCKQTSFEFIFSEEFMLTCIYLPHKIFIMLATVGKWMSLNILIVGSCFECSIARCYHTQSVSLWCLRQFLRILWLYKNLGEKIPTRIWSSGVTSFNNNNFIQILIVRIMKRGNNLTSEKQTHVNFLTQIRPCGC